MKTDLLTAIAAFNASCQPAIQVMTGRDGHTFAKLPRVGQGIVVAETSLNPAMKVTAQELALLCKEARLATAPGLALLDVALAGMKGRARE